MMELLCSNSSSSCVDVTQLSHYSHNSGPKLPNGDMLVELNCINGERISIELVDCLPLEIEYLNKIKVLLQGEEIFKKFGTSSSMNLKPFDPLDSALTPEQRQFGRRILKLSPCLKKLEILKPVATQQEHLTSQQSSFLIQQDAESYSNKNLQTKDPASSNVRSNNVLMESTGSCKMQLESSISLEKIIRLLIPTVTQDIVKFQKQGDSLRKF